MPVNKQLKVCLYCLDVMEQELLNCVLPVLPGPAELTPPPGPSQTLHVSGVYLEVPSLPQETRADHQHWWWVPSCGRKQRCAVLIRCERTGPSMFLPAGAL
ncbi:hypothetical protein Y1Q_0023733 [Alligator mississippiensis]|uniref:Uncharacterized protein n=1 Tax=Alligator mississippiensis TaxID=8496 RepID=A0A151MK10_ALLMI|nr:hypothetical protein Y1Q_0023733 [Alligator mississippiensis]